MNTSLPRKGLPNTVLRGILPGYLTAIIELLMWFVCGLRSIRVLEILGLLLILSLLALTIWVLVLAFRREFKAGVAAFCMLIAFFGLGQVYCQVYLYGARIYVHRHINLQLLHSWAEKELENHPDRGTVTLLKDDGISKDIFQMLQQPNELMVTRILDGTGELYVAWRGLGLWFATPGQGPAAEGTVEIADGVYLGINPTRQ